MDIVAVLITLAIGAVAGWLAGLLVAGAGFGLLWNILIGIAGAFMAALLFPRLGLGSTLSAEALLAQLLRQHLARLSCF